MVKETLRTGEKPTKAQIAEIRAAAARPVSYSEDAPMLTVEELAQFKKANASQAYQWGKGRIEEIQKKQYN